MSLSQACAGLASAVLVVAGPSFAGASAGEPVNLDAVQRIKTEGLRRSKVMDFASHLTDVHGPRLTGSPGYRAAGEYAAKALTASGLVNVRLERWGPFGRGWSVEHFDAKVTGLQPYMLVGYPKAWTPGTPGRVNGEAVMATLAKEEDLAAWRGKLKGKFLLLAPPRELRAPFEASAKRLSDAELAELAREADPTRADGVAGFGRAAQGASGGGDPLRLPLYMSPPAPNAPTPEVSPASADRAFVAKRMKFLVDEGVLAVLESGRGDAGLFVVASGGPRAGGEAAVVTQIVLAHEYYGRIARTLAKKLPVTLEMDVRTRFYDNDPMSFNVIAELPGTDKRGEVVMLGAHLDSWHAGTGATDNASGCAVVMEAARILKAAGLRLRRTVRVALWGGEEQGLLGSKAYVKAHFADRATMRTHAAHARLSAYYNLDNGTGAIRGIYAQSNDAVIPIIEAWMAPLRSVGVTTVSPRNTGGTDHLAFDEVGLPGFQFIQDPVDYESRTHHTNVDTYERLQPGDLMKSAVVMAVFAYHTANRDERLPRKPMPPAPTPARKPGAEPAAERAPPPAPPRPRSSPPPQAQPAPAPAREPTLPS